MQPIYQLSYQIDPLLFLYAYPIVTTIESYLFIRYLPKIQVNLFWVIQTPNYLKYVMICILLCYLLLRAKGFGLRLVCIRDHIFTLSNIFLATMSIHQLNIWH